MTTEYYFWVIRGIHGTGINTRSIPTYIGQIINRFMYIFSTIEQVNRSLDRVWKVYNEDGNDNLGDNDYWVDVTKEYVTFNLHWDKSDDPMEKYYPLQIETKEFISFLEALKAFIIKYENCEIPGLIPESKLETWTAVPNEYIKDEYWKTQEKPDV